MKKSIKKSIIFSSIYSESATTFTKDGETIGCKIHP